MKFVPGDMIVFDKSTSLGDGDVVFALNWREKLDEQFGVQFPLIHLKTKHVYLILQSMSDRSGEPFYLVFGDNHIAWVLAKKAHAPKENT